MRCASFVKRKFNAMLGVATVTMAVNFLVMLSGSLIAGNLVGPDGLAGLNVCTPVFAAVGFVASLLSVGSGLVFSQAMGEFDDRRAAGVWSQSAALALGVGALVFILMSVGGGCYMKFNGVTGEILRQAQAYWRWQTLQMALTPLSLLVMAMVYADGDSVVALSAGGVYVLGSIVLGTLFTWLGGDVGGVSAGIALATLGALAVASVHGLRRNSHLRFVRRFSLADLGKTLAGSAPDATIYLCWGLLVLVVNRFTVAVLGQQALLAVVALGASVVQFSIVFDGIGEALIPLGGMYAGEGNRPALRELANHSARMAVAEGVVCGLLMFVFAPQLCAAYGFGGEDAGLFAEAVYAMRVLSMAMPFMGFLMMANTHYLIVGHVKFAVSVTVFKDFVFPCLAALSCGGAFGFRGLWCGFVVGYALAAAYPLVWVALMHGRGLFPWLIPADGRSVNFAVFPDRESLAGACDRVVETLEAARVSVDVVARVTDTVRAVGGLVGAHNDGSVVYEIFVSVDDSGMVRLILRDGGRAFDVVKELGASAGGRYLNTLNSNRSEFFFRGGG